MKFTQQNVQCLSPSGLHRMAYTEWGDRQNPRVLVCVHGLTRNGRDFDALAEAMSAPPWGGSRRLGRHLDGRLDRHGPGGSGGDADWQDVA